MWGLRMDSGRSRRVTPRLAYSSCSIKALLQVFHSADSASPQSPPSFEEDGTKPSQVTLNSSDHSLSCAAGVWASG